MALLQSKRKSWGSLISQLDKIGQVSHKREYSASDRQQNVGQLLKIENEIGVVTHFNLRCESFEK